MIKITKTILTYFSKEWSIENKKRILKTFKIRVSNKKVLLKDNFCQKTIFEKKIKVYDKSNPLYKEFYQIKIGNDKWYYELSALARKYLVDTCNQWKKEDNARAPMNYTHRQIVFLDEQMYRLQEFFINDESYHCFLTKDLKLRDSAIQKFIYDRKPLYSPIILLEKVKIYAINNQLKYFNKNGNLLPSVIRQYLSGQVKLPMTEYEKIKSSTKRTEKEFLNLARTNVEDFDYFLTLTFANKEDKEKYERLNMNSVKHGEYDLKFIYVEDPSDYELCMKKLHVFLTNLSRVCKKEQMDLKYLGVPEYQKNGNMHYHFLISALPEEFLYNVPSWLDYDSIKQTRRYDKGVVSWKYGKSTLEVIEGKERIVNYISKYLTKSLEEIKDTVYLERLNKRRYYYSNNLKKPKIEYFKDNEIDNLFENDLIEPKIVYSNTNLNFYNQSQTILYQLKEFI